MDILKSLKLMGKYSSCPRCKNGYVNNGQGGIIVEDNTFRRWCKCGYDITVDENDNIIKIKKSKTPLTSFGKFTRKLRTDNNELLKDMATKLNVSPAYLSLVETGKRKLPNSWEDIITKSYELNSVQTKQINELFQNKENNDENEDCTK